MTTVSRRRFLGAALGVGGTMAFPASPLVFATQPGQAIESGFEERPGLDAIRNRITLWEEEGREFLGQELAPDSEAQWETLVRHYFDRAKFASISVNSANLCPSLRPVDQMVSLVQQMLNQDISFPLRGELAQASLGHGLDAMLAWFGLDQEGRRGEDLLALVANATQGNNFVNNGLVVSGFFDPQKDNVVVWDVNHPTNYEAWAYRKATQGWGGQSIRTLRTKLFSQSVSGEERRSGMFPSDPADEEEIIRALKRLVDERTRVVTLSWQSNECGMLLPMRRIVEEIRAISKDVHIHADSAQTFGVLDLQLDKTGVDSITGSFHKWPCGPKMVGILYMNGETGAARRFTPGSWGYDEYINTPVTYGFDPSLGHIDPTAKRFAYLGQQNDATLVATWITALFHTGRFHPGVTPARIEARTHYLGDQAKQALYSGLPKIFPDFTPETAYQWIATPTANDKLRSSVFLFKCPAGLQAGDVMHHVYTHHKFAIANLSVHGHDLLRISPTFCNTAQDVHDVVDAVVDVIGGMQKGRLAGLGHVRAYA